MKITKLLLAAALSLSCSLPAVAADNSATKTLTPDKMDRGDKKFFEGAAQAGMAEVEMAKVAQQRATAKGVKDFADMMTMDHGSNNQELKDLAAKKGVTPASALDGKHAGMVKKLQDADADHFDTEYIKANKAAHEHAISLFKDASKDSKDPDVKAFAMKTLPTLEKHLGAVEALNKAGGK